MTNTTHTSRLAAACVGFALIIGAATVTASTPPGEPPAIATLRVVAGDDGYLAWAINRLSGPIEVRLENTDPRTSIVSDPALPARASVPAGGRVLVAWLHPVGAQGRMALRLRGVPGSSNAKPKAVTYLIPLRQPDPRIDQGFEGTFSHHDAENRYALDFAAPIGTPVVAARDGVVMQTQSGFTQSGLEDRHFADRTNFVRILHDDGSMALYAHLMPGGVLVHPGQRVTLGERIGLSGNTGFSTAPHLHFAVQVNRGFNLVSIPFRMQGVALPNHSSVDSRAVDASR